MGQSSVRVRVRASVRARVCVRVKVWVRVTTNPVRNGPSAQRT